ncbi:hypothetical protein [Actinophytocola sp.]|uniref:hypothetical protein n=1 Tax=Actinophytocola sp. TaxID=1872138 RepID=UPI002ED6046D
MIALAWHWSVVGGKIEGMSSVRFTGECWISEADTRPGLDEGGFGTAWRNIGHVDRSEQDLWQHFAKSSSRRSAEFYISIMETDLAELPTRFWLGLEWVTGQLFVATGPAKPRVLARRPPELSPGLLRRPARRLSVRVTAEKGHSLFERFS